MPLIVTSKKVGSVWPDPPKLQPHRWGRRSDGRFATQTYVSMSPSEIYNMAAQAEALRLNYEVDERFGGSAAITIDYNFNFAGGVSGSPSATDEVEESWETTPTKNLKSILDVANDPLIMACTEPELNEMKRRLKSNTILDDQYFDSTTGKLFRQAYDSGSSSVLFGDPAMQIYKMLVDGSDQVEVYGWTLSHNKVVTGNYPTRASIANVGRIFSQSTLIATEGVPTAALFDLPADVDPAPVQIGDLPIYQSFLYGWQKNAPSIREISNRKWSISQSWDYGLWLINKFGGVRL